MRVDVFRVIKESSDITNAIILTHNIDFIFIQSMVLPALRKCGSSTLTIFADADCAAQTYQHQSRVISGLGLRYRVVPVAMNPGFRFHPKALLLSGPKAGTLLVGSGNLTFGGWRENGEVWSRFDTQIDQTAPFAGFRDYLHEVIDICVEPKLHIKGEVDEAFDPNTRQWAETMETGSRILGRAGRGVSMLDRMKLVLAGRPVSRIYVCTPYFDENAEALKAVAREFEAPSCTVLVQSKRTNLMVNAAASLGAAFELQAARFEHREKLSSDGPERIREAFLHAKFYAAEAGDEVVVFAGSANCSNAGLTIPGVGGNAELMTHVTLPLEQFTKDFIDELVVENAAPELATEYLGIELPPEGAVYINIRAARMESNSIHIAFQASLGTTVANVIVDEQPIEVATQGDGWVIVSTTQHQPRLVMIVGLNELKEVRSPIHWIDNENALSVSARDRSLADSIHGAVRGSRWGIGAWTDVLSELYRNLQYMPKGDSTRRFATHSGRDGGDPAQTFVWSDVFAQGYGLPMGFPLLRPPADLDERMGGLRSLLLHWFGIAQTESAEVADSAQDDDSTSTKDDSLEDLEVVDKQEKLKKGPLRRDVAAATGNERKRAIRLVNQVAKRFGDPEFLSQRLPEQLAADLKVAALLLRAGLADAWLSDEEFFDATLQIWMPLFFNSDSNDNCGWLEQRYRTAANREEFAAAVRSVELAATLACWALSTPQKLTSPRHAFFVLASVLSVARLPWLWQIGSNDEIAKRVADVFTLTFRRQDSEWTEIERRWLELIRRGYALDQLEKSIGKLTVVDLSKRISQSKVSAGELLWQGSLGFCVAEKECERGLRQKVKVHILQNSGASKTLSGPHLIPLSGVLNGDAISELDLPKNARNELAIMVEEFRSANVSPVVLK